MYVMYLLPSRSTCMEGDYDTLSDAGLARRLYGFHLNDRLNQRPSFTEDQGLIHWGGE